MTPNPQTRADAATAGLTVVGSMLVGAAVGYGLGSLAGLAIPVGLIGLFAGLVGGLIGVYARYKRL
jgi:F0F1-type ATP synthase assembly protein I